MKKQFLLIAFVACCSISFAQKTTPSFGFNAGISSAGLKGDAAQSLNNLLDFSNGMISTSNRTGFFAGGYANIPLSGNISIEPGLYYTQKGYQMKGDLNVKGLEFLGANATANLNSQYIDIPLLFKADFDGLQVFVGPQVSYLLQSDLKLKAGVLGFNLLNKTLDATSQFNRWDAGVTGGLGYQFKNGLNLSASYDYGLMKADANQNMDVYNRGFKLGLGISL
ncbi:MAG: porin family protein [Ferruginibacter sp.]